MAYTITSESYGRRLPKITATADSTDDLAALGTNYAEGSTVNVGGTVYSLDKVSGWIVPGSGGGGGGGLLITLTVTGMDGGVPQFAIDKTHEEIKAAGDAGVPIAVKTPSQLGGFILYASMYSYNASGQTPMVTVVGHTLNVDTNVFSEVAVMVFENEAVSVNMDTRYQLTPAT